MQSEMTRPIVGIENRTAQEVFDIMCDRFKIALSAAEPWPFEHQNYNCPCIHPSQCDESCVKKPAPSVAVKALADAYQKYLDASALYNERLAIAKTKSPGTMRVDEERKAIDDARRAFDKLAVEVATSALSAQVQDVAGWRPIETAPKDESIIMLFRADEKHWASISTGYFKNDRFARNPKPYWGGPHERSLGIRWYRENPPTHWMPLPAAPAKQEG